MSSLSDSKRTTHISVFVDFLLALNPRNLFNCFIEYSCHFHSFSFASCFSVLFFVICRLVIVFMIRKVHWSLWIAQIAVGVYVGVRWLSRNIMYISTNRIVLMQ